MSEAVFLRVLEAAPEAKGERLRSALREFRLESEAEGSDGAFIADSADFSVVPGSPFAYWVGEPIRRIFREFPPLEGNVATVKQGLATADDFRFVRAWWEIPPARIGYSAEDSENGRGWIHFAKGGSYSPYYADVHLVVNWFGAGAEIKNYVIQRYPYIKGNWAWVVKNEDYYFRSGLTFPRRTHRLAPSALPEDCLFSHGGQAAFPISGVTPAGLIGLLSSLPFFALLRIQLPRLDADPQFEVGQIQRTPAITQTELGQLDNDALEAIQLVCELSSENECCHAFRPPLQSISRRETLLETSTGIAQQLTATAESLAEIAKSIDLAASRAYRLGETDFKRLQSEILPAPEVVAESGVASKDGIEASIDVDNTLDDQSARAETIAANALLWCVGVVLGRWDVRMARDGSLIPELQGPFDRLPRVAPGGLVRPDGLPASEGRIASEAWLRARPNVITLPEPGSFEGPDAITAAEYPIEVAWDGILVDDPGHPRDIVRKMREVLSYVYGDRAGEIEEEALEILRGDGRTPRTLRDWFRSQKATALGKNFFDFHIQRYSKSRRKAPIYWHLCSSPGRGQSQYGVWLYYHRLTDDTLWTVLNEYVRPKVELEERRLAELRTERGRGGGGGVRQVEKEIEEKVELLEELEWFQRELRKVAEPGYAPDLDDGVIINMAPLHELVPWKEAAKVWGELEKGEYDWSKLAMRYWPERVETKCREDKSFAIAHDRLGLLEQRHDT